ncbi:MAG TPA: hypothetical protein VND99_01895 [Candidatus Acidoferrales bacterium]|nr:hypothetical protein [Candidatus Acidoferrales bacterium]
MRMRGDGSGRGFTDGGFVPDRGVEARVTGSSFSQPKDHIEVRGVSSRATGLIVTSNYPGSETPISPSPGLPRSIQRSSPDSLRTASTGYDGNGGGGILPPTLRGEAGDDPEKRTAHVFQLLGRKAHQLFSPRTSERGITPRREESQQGRIAQENQAPRPRRYVPEGHTERLEQLHAERRKAIREEEDIGHKIPEAIREAIFLSLDEENSTAFTRGRYGAYRRALEKDHWYRMEVYREKQNALEFLKKMAAPYLVEPPEGERGTIQVREGDGKRSVPVPFDRDELPAIAKAEEAYWYLRRDAAVGSGYGREFAMDTMNWPSGTRLLQRDKAVLGIFLTAQYAEGELLRDHGARGITPDMIPHLTRLANLPDRLIQHAPHSEEKTP